MNKVYEKITLMLIEDSAFMKGKDMEEPRSQLAKMYRGARKGKQLTRADISDRLLRAGESGEKPTGDQHIDSIIKGVALTGERRAGGMGRRDPERVSNIRRKTAGEIIRRYGKESIKRNKR